MKTENPLPIVDESHARPTRSGGHLRDAPRSACGAGATRSGRHCLASYRRKYRQRAVHVGTALGGVKLLVWQADYGQASQILFPEEFDAEPDRERRKRKRWKCARCREWNEPAFDLCWSCGGDYQDPPSEPVAADLAASDAIAPAGLASFSEVVSEFDSRAGNSRDQAENPYAPSRYRAVSELPASPEPGIDHDLDAVVTRAWRAAVIGLVFCPVVLHFYSMWLLLSATFSTKTMSPMATRWFYATLAVDVLVLSIVGLVAWLL